MKILIVYMILHDLRVAEPLALARLRQQLQLLHQQQQQSLDIEALLGRDDGAPDDARWWSDKRLLDEPIGIEERKRVAITLANHPEESSARIRVTARSSCSCESDYKVNDLGAGHYPRYLSESRCKPKTCQSKLHLCKQLNYTVHVLSERESEEWKLNSGKQTETPLPTSLRHKWQLKPMSVTVACVPDSVNRRN
ncbi:prothoracicotropic hormone-like [Andrena cerasifolii]|uniref:prothoracicotropic hormone-like n=1 Tax=Andrena cerasifolii TaxID=2819439 RepID=UPI004037F80E